MRLAVRRCAALPRRSARAVWLCPTRPALALPVPVSVPVRTWAAAAHPTPPGAAATFVSAHYAVDADKIRQYLARKNFTFAMSSGNKELTLKVCPFCHDTKNKPDNHFKLSINLTNGLFFCHRCNAKGSWFDFQKRLGDLNADVTPIAPFSAPPPSTPSKSFAGRASASISGFSPASSIPSGVQTNFPEPWKLPKSLENLKLYKKVHAYLTGTGNGQRHLTDSTLAAYKVGAGVFRFRDLHSQEWVERECVTFPWLERRSVLEAAKSAKALPAPLAGEHADFVLLRMKYRPVDVKDFRIDPAGGEWSLFGLHLVPETAEEIIVTEGEIDAMSVFQVTGRPAVSLPNGASSLPLEIVEKLEKYKRIFLWMDDDVKGQEGAEKFANKLGQRRCLLVHSHYRGEKPSADVKDANDALRAGLDLARLLAEAAVIPHKQILTFAELRDHVYMELANPKQVAGLPCTTVPSLNQILKGHRRGELTILTGPTGAGKTSMISQLSIDYCAQGVNTLWGSFELQNTALLKKMLTQFAAKSLEKNIEEFNFWADKFAELALYFMRFYGTTGIDEVLDAMEYACYVYDVEHVVLDNLQFMTGSQHRGYEKFDALDQAIEKLRRFSTEKMVHITLVVHPRKEDDGTALSTSSVFGSAKATQEADNVLIIQTPPGRPYRTLQVVKNRHSGDVGAVNYRFDPESQKYYELTRRETEALDRQAPASTSAAFGGGGSGAGFSRTPYWKYAKAKKEAAERKEKPGKADAEDDAF